MGTQKKTSNGMAGEAGHQGHDRQPARDAAKSNGGTPDATVAATPADVGARSQEAAATRSAPRQGADIAHPGPDRMEAEKSKGDVHHNQHEKEKDMQNKVQDI